MPDLRRFQVGPDCCSLAIQRGQGPTHAGMSANLEAVAHVFQACTGAPAPTPLR